MNKKEKIKFKIKLKLVNGIRIYECEINFSNGDKDEFKTEDLNDVINLFKRMG